MRAHFTVPMGMRQADRRNVVAIMERCRAAGMHVELQFIGENMPRVVDPPPGLKASELASAPAVLEVDDSAPGPAPIVEAVKVSEFAPDWSGWTDEQTLARGRYDWLISIGMDPLNAAEVTRRDYPKFDPGVTP